jgi:hypothetical protein
MKKENKCLLTNQREDWECKKENSQPTTSFCPCPWSSQPASPSLPETPELHANPSRPTRRSLLYHGVVLLAFSWQEYPRVSEQVNVSKGFEAVDESYLCHPLARVCSRLQPCCCCGGGSGGGSLLCSLLGLGRGGLPGSVLKFWIRKKNGRNVEANPYLESLLLIPIRLAMVGSILLRNFLRRYSWLE